MTVIKRLVLELEEPLHKRIKGKALKENKTMREIMISLLKEWLEKK